MGSPIHSWLSTESVCSEDGWRVDDPLASSSHTMQNSPRQEQDQAMSPMPPGDWRKLLGAAGQEREPGSAGVGTVTPVCSSLLCNKCKSPVDSLFPLCKPFCPVLVPGGTLL